MDQCHVDPEQQAAEQTIADGLGIGGGDAFHFDDFVAGLLEELAQ